MLNSNLPSSKDDAKKLKSIYYFTNIPCINNHLSIRYTSNGKCKECIKNTWNKWDTKNKSKRLEIQKRYRGNNKNQIKNKLHDYYLKNKIKIKEYNSSYYKKNKIKIYKQTQEYKNQNIDKYKQYQINYQKKKRLCPKYRLNQAISQAINRCLIDKKLNKKIGKHWESLVSFSKQELIKHLESLFNKNMNWENYGSYWEVDHIKPISLCTTFEETWQLSNLQPLEISINRSKRNSYIG